MPTNPPHTIQSGHLVEGNRMGPDSLWSDRQHRDQTQVGEAQRSRFRRTSMVGCNEIGKYYIRIHILTGSVTRQIRKASETYCGLMKSQYREGTCGGLPPEGSTAPIGARHIWGSAEKRPGRSLTPLLQAVFSPQFMSFQDISSMLITNEGRQSCIEFLMRVVKPVTSDSLISGIRGLIDNPHRLRNSCLHRFISLTGVEQSITRSP
jgi:hypothetical protein